MQKKENYPLFFSKIYMYRSFTRLIMAGVILDAKDKKILYELDLNGREFISTIAKRVGLSKEVVNYRIKRLQEKGVLEGFHAIINPSKTGYLVYRLHIKYQNVTPDKEKELIQYFSSHQNIGWVTAYEGLYDMAILYWARDAYEFREKCDELLSQYGKYFHTTKQSIILQIHGFKHNYLFNSHDYTEAVVGGKVEPAPLDEIDMKILHLLAADCRRTTLEIGKELGLSPNTVKYRIKKLIDNKVIVGFRTIINANVLGYQHYKLFIQFYEHTEKTRQKIISYLKISPHVIYVTEALGLADLEFEAQVKDIAQLHELIRNLKLQFGSLIRDTSSALIFKEHRINYLPSI